MAFFKFRKGGGDTVATPTQSESVEAMRKRARQRLIGAAVLVLVGVIGFPLVFDTQPRPIAVDIPIDIPDRVKAKPLASPAAAVGNVTQAQGGTPASPTAAFVPSANLAGATDASSSSAPAAAKASAAEGAARVETKSASASDAKPAASEAKAAHVEAKAETDAKHETKADAKHDTKAEAKHDAKDGDRAKALLEGKTPTAAAAAVDGRFVIQVGAFSDATKAQAARKKLEKAGLKTYTHVAETKEGKRIRVRVGPFATRAEAEKAAGKVKGQDLPAAILTL